jgi:hypothetical protein
MEHREKAKRKIRKGYKNKEIFCSQGLRITPRDSLDFMGFSFCIDTEFLILLSSFCEILMQTANTWSKT